MKTTTNGLMGLASVKKSTAKKSDKVTVNITDDTVSNAIDTYIQAKERNDKEIAIMSQASGIIKSDGGQKKWIEEMERTGKAPESFIMVSKKNNSLMYVVTDAYKTANLDEERQEYLTSTFGDEIITVGTKFVINEDLIEKYGQILCDFITNSKLIKAEDKSLLIQKEETIKITKGTKDRLRDIAKKSKLSVGDVFDAIQPTCQIKVYNNR